MTPSPVEQAADLMETIRCGSVEVPHNTVKWQTKTNRHTTTIGNLWGWIEGAPGNVCWSNDNNVFNSAEAGRVAREHNERLENQRPISLRMVECQERIQRAATAVENHRKQGEPLQIKLDFELNELHRLAAISESEKQLSSNP